MNPKIRLFRYGYEHSGQFDWIIVGENDYDNICYTKDREGKTLTYKNQNLETVLEGMTYVRDMTQEELVAEMV